MSECVILSKHGSLVGWRPLIRRARCLFEKINTSCGGAVHHRDKLAFYYWPSHGGYNLDTCHIFQNIQYVNKKVRGISLHINLSKIISKAV
jgi:hypothetical protein